MPSKLLEIQDAINKFEMDHARELLREELENNPSAEVYYLASQAAVNHGQRVHFLEQALEEDPFHKEAYDELQSTLPRDTLAQAKTKTKNQLASNVQLADTSRRLIAFLIDSLILGFVGVMVGAVIGAVFAPQINEYAMMYDEQLMAQFLQWQMTIMAIGILINIVYHIYFMSKNNGQTPGKTMMKIRVVKKDGTPITIADAFIRNVIGYAISSFFMLGYIWAIFDSERQGWHDKITGTIVVDDK